MELDILEDKCTKVDTVTHENLLMDYYLLLLY
jgi:hypothetical protein